MQQSYIWDLWLVQAMLPIPLQPQEEDLCHIAPTPPATGLKCYCDVCCSSTNDTSCAVHADWALCLWSDNLNPWQIRMVLSCLPWPQLGHIAGSYFLSGNLIPLFPHSLHKHTHQVWTDSLFSSPLHETSSHCLTVDIMVQQPEGSVRRARFTLNLGPCSQRELTKELRKQSHIHETVYSISVCWFCALEKCLP